MAAAQQAPQQQPETPRPDTVQPAAEQPPAPGSAPKLGHPLDPEDVRVLTSKPETSIPAAERTGYGAPQVYMGYAGAYGGVPMFNYRGGVPLFRGAGLSPFPVQFGFVPRPFRPVGPFQFFSFGHRH